MSKIPRVLNIENATRLVISMERCSTSLIQRYFKVGYGEAYRMVDKMEEEGIVSAPDPDNDHQREVLIDKVGKL